jgi:hypothetical protein
MALQRFNCIVCFYMVVMAEARINYPC